MRPIKRLFVHCVRGSTIIALPHSLLARVKNSIFMLIRFSAFVALTTKLVRHSASDGFAGEGASHSAGRHSTPGTFHSTARSLSFVASVTNRCIYVNASSRE
jgi:hypothetical protein